MTRPNDWQRTTLGEALPIRYGQACTEKAGRSWAWRDVQSKRIHAPNHHAGPPVAGASGAAALLFSRYIVFQVRQAIDVLINKDRVSVGIDQNQSSPADGEP